MSPLELLREVALVAWDSVVMLSKILTNPPLARAYADSFDLPLVTAPTGWADRVQALSTVLEEERYAQFLTDLLAVVDELRSLLSDLEDGSDVGIADFPRRLFLPVVMFCLQRGDEPTWANRGVQFALTVLIFLDERLQEWTVPASTDARWAQVGAGILSKLDYDQPNRVPNMITDGFFVTATVLNLVWLRGVGRRALALDQDLLRTFYGFEHPADEERTAVLRALRRSSTLAVADFTQARPLAQSDYQAFSAEPPVREPALATLTLTPFVEEPADEQHGSVLGVRAAVGQQLEGVIHGRWRYRMVVRGGAGLAIPFGDEPPDVDSQPDAEAQFEVFHDDEPSALVDPKTEGFAFHAARVRLGLGADVRELKAWLRLERARISFGRLPVLELLAPEGFGVDQDVGIVWSSRDGLRFEGGGPTELLLPIDKLIGGKGFGLRVRELRIAREPGEEGGRKTYRLAVTATVGAEFGTAFRFYLQGGGGAMVLTFAQNQPRSFASLTDMDFEPVPPSGIALAVNFKNKVVGGGYLRRDPDGERWVGAAELAVVDKWGLQGLIVRDRVDETRDSWLVIASVLLPGGSPGITIRAFGVIFATHRTSDPEALLAGVATGALDALLFPEDPIGRAAQYAAVLDRLLPIQAGSEVVGMAVKVSALADRLTVDLALLYDTGGDRGARVYVLGQLDLVLPTAKSAVAKIHADLVAAYDVASGELIIVAELRDSRLFGGELTGGLLFFRGDPDGAPGGDWVKLLSIGGFHPSYVLPGPRIRAPRRVRMVVERGDKVRLDAQVYFAITAGSLQFGGSMELRARFAGFGLRARLSVDVLFSSLTRFEITLEASVEILLGSRSLAGAAFKGVLSGMHESRLVGRARISFLFFSYTTPQFTLPLPGLGSDDGDGAQLDVLTEVLAALSTAQAWDGGGTPGLVLGAAERPGVWLSPSAPLRVRQDVAPLEVPLDRFGAMELGDPLTLRVERVRAGARDLASTPLTGHFAPAMYQDLSEEEKLSGSGFADHVAGFEIERPLQTGAAVPGDLSYEEIVIDGARRGPRTVGGFELAGALLTAARELDSGAPPPPDRGPVRIHPERFTVVDASLTPIATDLDAMSARALARALAVPGRGAFVRVGGEP